MMERIHAYDTVSIGDQWLQNRREFIAATLMIRHGWWIRPLLHIPGIPPARTRTQEQACRVATGAGIHSIAHSWLSWTHCWESGRAAISINRLLRLLRFCGDVTFLQEIHEWLRCKNALL